MRCESGSSRESFSSSCISYYYGSLSRSIRRSMSGSPVPFSQESSGFSSSEPSLLLSSSDELSLSKLCSSYFLSPLFAAESEDPVMPTFFYILFCLLMIKRNSFSYWMNILPKYSMFWIFLARI